MSESICLSDDIRVTGLRLSQYITNGAMGVIALMETPDGLEEEAISINLPVSEIQGSSRGLDPDCFYAKNFEQGQPLLKTLIEAGWIELTKHEATFIGIGGHFTVPICKLTARGQSMVDAGDREETEDLSNEDYFAIEDHDAESLSAADRWWRLLDQNWEKLLSICEQFLYLDQLAGKTPFDFGGGRAVYIPVSKRNPKVDGSLREDIARCRMKRDVRLSLYLHAAWAEAPDDFSVHLIPGWSVLCNLCQTAAESLPRST